jgi:hypothetical protein
MYCCKYLGLCHLASDSAYVASAQSFCTRRLMRAIGSFAWCPRMKAEAGSHLSAQSLGFWRLRVI